MVLPCMEFPNPGGRNGNVRVASFSSPGPGIPTQERCTRPGGMVHDDEDSRRVGPLGERGPRTAPPLSRDPERSGILRRGPAVYGDVAKELIRHVATREASLSEISRMAGDTPVLRHVAEWLEAEASTRRSLFNQAEKMSRGVQGINLNRVGLLRGPAGTGAGGWHRNRVGSRRRNPHRAGVGPSDEVRRRSQQRRSRDEACAHEPPSSRSAAGMSGSRWCPARSRSTTTCGTSRGP